MTSNNAALIMKTIAITASISLVLAIILLFLCFKCYHSRRRENDISKRSFRREALDSFRRHEKDCFGLGKLEEKGGQMSTSNNNIDTKSFFTLVFNPSFEEEEEKRVLDSPERVNFRPQEMSNSDSNDKDKTESIQMVETQASVPFKPPSDSHQTNISFTPTPSPSPPPPPPPLMRPMAMARARTSESTSTNWILSRRTSGKGRETNKINYSNGSSRENSDGNNVVGQMKLKPLHWEKVSPNVDHSTVWDEISDGSLRFDDELMENLFGYSKASPESSERANIFSYINKSSNPPTQIFLLDPRKSQNTAIVLRSLAISRREIIDALTDGNELSSESLEKLTKITPTQEETAKILRFNGNPTKLADAESFLFHILRAVPSAFSRFEAMAFRSNYNTEILHLKESLQTLESACNELKARGLFLKLLEAILKAGNRMNRGTSRGDAQGFDLNSLTKLSDIKSNDGKTTLLHFVVEQVARSEGKKDIRDCRSSDKDEEDRYSVARGLEKLEGLSTRELSNVKKAASLDHRNLVTLIESLGTQVTEIRKNLAVREGGREWFSREMKGFLEECEEKLRLVREEQRRVMEFVTKTTEYYQVGGGYLRDKKPSNANPYKLFVIVKDFLDAVDQVCVQHKRKLLQKRNNKVDFVNFM